MKWSWIFLFCVMGLRAWGVDITFPQGVAHGPSSVIIPFEYYEGLILLEGKIGQQEGKFILDTGANGLVLNSRYFKAESISSSTALGVSGGVGRVGESTVENVKIENAMFRDLKAEHIDLEEVEKRKRIRIMGLLGYEVIKDFEIMLNYREKYVCFSKLDQEGEIKVLLPHSIERIDSFAFTLGNFIPVIEITIQGVSKKMGIDTGAEFNVLDNKRNRDIISNFKVMNRINLTGAGGSKKQALAGVLYRAQLGEKYKCASMATVMTNMRNLNSIYKTNLDGILGHPFLAPWVFSINYKKEMLYFHSLTYART